MAGDPTHPEWWNRTIRELDPTSLWHHALDLLWHRERRKGGRPRLGQEMRSWKSLAVGRSRTETCFGGEFRESRGTLGRKPAGFCTGEDCEEELHVIQVS